VTAHVCDDWCVCPLDGKPLLYSPAVDQHACQDPDCANAHEVEPDPIGELWKSRLAGRQVGKTKAMRELTEQAVAAGRHVDVVGRNGKTCVSGDCDGVVGAATQVEGRWTS
jgi:hypothetical protein